MKQKGRARTRRRRKRRMKGGNKEGRNEYIPAEPVKPVMKASLASRGAMYSL